MSSCCYTILEWPGPSFFRTQFLRARTEKDKTTDLVLAVSPSHFFDGAMVNAFASLQEGSEFGPENAAYY